MRKAKTLAACLGVLFVLTLTSSVARADALRGDDMVVKLKNNQGHHFDLLDEARAGTIPLFAEFFENNNGLHLGLLKNGNGNHFGLFKDNGKDVEFEDNNGRRSGFSVASTNRGNRFGLFRGPQTTSGAAAIPNPEPAAVFLLGTGLAAVGALARRRFRKSGK